MVDLVSLSVKLLRVSVRLANSLRLIALLSVRLGLQLGLVSTSLLHSPRALLSRYRGWCMVE